MKVKRANLPPLVTVKYTVERFIDGEYVNQVIADLLSSPEREENGITSEFEGVQILEGLDGFEAITVPATETGLAYIVVTGQPTDSLSEGDLTPDIFHHESATVKPLVIIPVLEKLTPAMAADALALML